MSKEMGKGTGKGTIIKDFLDFVEKVFPESTIKLITPVYGVPFSRCASIAELRTSPKYRDILEKPMSKYEEVYEMGERIIEIFLNPVEETREEIKRLDRTEILEDMGLPMVTRESSTERNKK